MAEQAQRTGLNERLEGVRKAVLNPENAKKAAKWYIETSERLANEALDFQASATSWAKDTALARLFETQNEVGRSLVERSASAARAFWRIETN